MQALFKQKQYQKPQVKTGSSFMSTKLKINLQRLEMFLIHSRWSVTVKNKLGMVNILQRCII